MFIMSSYRKPEIQNDFLKSPKSSTFAIGPRILNYVNFRILNHYLIAFLKKSEIIKLF